MVPKLGQLTVSKTQIDNDTAEIETATHILCDCPAFSKTRIGIYGNHTLTPDKLFSSKISSNLKNIIYFIKKTKVFERKPKLTKKDLSPRKVLKKRKRKTITKKNNDTKRIKVNSMWQYYQNIPEDINYN